MHPLERMARERPAHTALRQGSRSISRGELHRMASALAAVLREAYALTPATRVATLLPRDIDHAIVLHALLLAGATVLPLNARLPHDTLRGQLLRCDVRLLIHGGEHSDLLAGRTLSWSALREHMHGPARPLPTFTMPDNDATLSMLFTSGSTGAAKAVPHTWGMHRASAEASRLNMGGDAHDAWLCPIPLHHIGGLAILVRCLLYGATMVLPDTESTTDMMDELRNGITLVSLVPTQLYRLLRDHPDLVSTELPALRAILLGGAAASPMLWGEVARRGLPVIGSYGMTETCSQIVAAPLGRAREFHGSAGVPLHGVTVRTHRDDGTLADPGEVGEIHVAGPMVMSGYLDDDERNARCFERGLFRTGDIGVLDDRGALTVLSRREDLLISGGENVYPQEVEHVLVEHPDVRDAVVLGVDDEEWGQRIAAVLECVTLDEASLRQWCRERLPAYSVPVLWRRVEALPRTASGKIDRAAARMLMG